MAAPASEDLRELERDLELAAERGETVTRAEVQEKYGAGAGDVDEMLNVLREHGKAFEVAPGEWRGPTLAELEEARAAVVEPPRVKVSVPDGDGDVDPDFAARAERLSDAITRRRLLGATGERVAMVAGEPTVRLTRAIAAALDADALGKVVQAALDGLEDGEVFVLEVTP